MPGLRSLAIGVLDSRHEMKPAHFIPFALTTTCPCPLEVAFFFVISLRLRDEAELPSPWQALLWIKCGEKRKGAAKNRKTYVRGMKDVTRLMNPAHYSFDLSTGKPHSAAER